VSSNLLLEEITRDFGGRTSSIMVKHFVINILGFKPLYKFQHMTLSQAISDIQKA
jgi:hypothetical protein